MKRKAFGILLLLRALLGAATAGMAPRQTLMRPVEPTGTLAQARNPNVNALELVTADTPWGFVPAFTGSPALAHANIDDGHERDHTDTCGIIQTSGLHRSGDSATITTSRWVYINCVGPDDMFCANDGVGFMGCCHQRDADGPSSTCTNVPTMCLDRDASLRGACEDQGQRTTCCKFTDRPYCRTFMYPTETTSGTTVTTSMFLMLGCFAEGGVMTMYPPVRPSATTPPNATIATTSQDIGTETLGAPSPSESTYVSGPTPIGTIIGSIFGAIAFLAFIGCCIWFMVYKSRRGQQATAQHCALEPQVRGGNHQSREGTQDTARFPDNATPSPGHDGPVPSPVLIGLGRMPLSGSQPSSLAGSDPASPQICSDRHGHLASTMSAPMVTAVPAESSAAAAARSGVPTLPELPAHSPLPPIGHPKRPAELE